MDVYGDSYGQLSANELAANSQRQQALQSAMVNLSTTAAAAQNRRLQEKQLGLYKDQLDAGGTPGQQRAAAMKWQLLDHAAESGDVDQIEAFRGDKDVPDPVINVYTTRAKQNQEVIRSQHRAADAVVGELNDTAAKKSYVANKADLEADPYKTGMWPLRSESPEHAEWQSRLKQTEAELPGRSTRSAALLKQYQDKLGWIAPDESGSGYQNVLPRPGWMDRVKPSKTGAEAGGASSDEQGAATAGRGRNEQPADYEAAAYGPSTGGRKGLTPAQVLKRKHQALADLAPETDEDHAALIAPRGDETLVNPRAGMRSPIPPLRPYIPPENGQDGMVSNYRSRSPSVNTVPSIQSIKARVKLPDGTIGQVPLMNLPELKRRHPGLQILN